MPASCAICANFFGVRCWFTFMNTVFTEFAVACLRLIVPQLMLSAFGTSAHVPGVVSKRSGELPLNIVLKFTSSIAAPSRPKGFMVEPGWKFACVALLSWCLR